MMDFTRKRKRDRIDYRVLYGFNSEKEVDGKKFSWLATTPPDREFGVGFLSILWIEVSAKLLLGENTRRGGGDNR